MWMVVVFSAFDIIFFRFPQSTFHFVNRTVARSQINNMIIIYQILVCARLNINIHHRCGGAVFLEQKIDPDFRYTFFVFCRTYRRAYCTSCPNFLCCALRWDTICIFAYSHILAHAQFLLCKNRSEQADLSKCKWGGSRHRMRYYYALLYIKI